MASKKKKGLTRLNNDQMRTAWRAECCWWRFDGGDLIYSTEGSVGTCYIRSFEDCMVWGLIKMQSLF
jgi:hypothetical protein